MSCFPISSRLFAAPELLQDVELREPIDLLKLPLISPSDPWWLDWFAAAGVHDVDLSRRPDNSLGVQQFEGMAAIAGQGVALINPFFFPDDLASGRLVKPFDLLATTDRSYWLVYPKGRQRSAKIEAFRDWVLSEVAGDSERAAPAAKMGTGT